MSNNGGFNSKRTPIQDNDFWCNTILFSEMQTEYFNPLFLHTNQLYF